MLDNLSIEQASLIVCVAIGGVVGLFRGLSGGLGTLGGLAAATAAGWFLFDPISSLIISRGWLTGSLEQRIAAIVVDGIIGLLAFGIVRKLIEKFVRYLVSRPFDAFLGAIVGGALGFAIWHAGQWAVNTYLGNPAA